jgi:RNA polymerase sigma factor (sigma-70 family)
LQTDSEQLMMYAESTLDADMEIFAEREQQFLKLRNAMQQLGDPCAKLLKSFYRKEMTMQEIAHAFGYTNAENAKSQKYKCLARLKKIYTDL